MSGMNKTWQKWLLVGIVLALVVAFIAFDLRQYFSLDYIKSQQARLQDFYWANPLTLILLFAGVYVAVTALSLPGAAILTLASGAIFGLVFGTIIASLSSTVGATIAFLISRFVFSDTIRARFSEKIKVVDRGIEKDGAFYLFALRLAPVIPFFVINMVMGLTHIRMLTYALVSMAGMLPGTIAFVNAGTQLAKIDSLGDVLSISVLLSFAALALVPLAAKWSVDAWKVHRRYKNFRKPRKFEYDMIVIGAGSAGLVSSLIGAAVKAKVALVERHKMGGDCLNTGCVPSKALIRSAKIANYLKRASEFGLENAHADVDFTAVMERIQRVIKTIEPHDSVERYTSLGVDCIQGQAMIVSPFEVRVGERVLTTRNIIIATGARPFVPPIPGLENVAHYTSDTLWDIRQKPRHMVILGGGPIGCELTQAFHRLGVDVTLVEMAPRLLGREDSEAAEFVLKRFRSENVKLKLSHKAERIDKRTDGASEIVCRDENGKEVRLECDALVLALGRRANVKGFGLEELGIKTTERGTLERDEKMRTIYPNIFTCGDVAGPWQFTHTASHQAWFAAVNALFRPFKQFDLSTDAIPWCTYTDPEVGRVGMSEDEAKEAGIEYVKSVYPFDDLDRAICEGEDHGFVKVLTRKGSDKILGALIVGAHAGDLINEFTLAMKNGLGLNKILGTIHVYPTFAEANKFAAGVWKRQTAPHGVLKWLERFHAFRRGDKVL